MSTDLLSSVTELTRRIRREQAALTRAMAQAREVRDGTDESGTITVLIDADGTAHDVRVAADWRQRLRLADLGAAVVAADGEAARRRAQATTEALTAAHQEAATAYGSTQDGTSLSTGDDRGADGWLVPVPLDGATRAGRRRSLAELSTAVLAAFEDLERVTEPPPPIHGAGADGSVRVTVAQGRITECVINQAWLAHQDEITLGYALREAVCAAATAGLAARRPFIEYQQRLDAIVADARATLNHLSAGAHR